VQVGLTKTDAAAKTLAEINPDVELEVSIRSESLLGDRSL
jgi:hypothetical protein